MLQYNRIASIPYEPCGFGAAVLWRTELAHKGLMVSINSPRGTDIDTGCGQLAART